MNCERLPSVINFNTLISVNVFNSGLLCRHLCSYDNLGLGVLDNYYVICFQGPPGPVGDRGDPGPMVMLTYYHSNHSNQCLIDCGYYSAYFQLATAIDLCICKKICYKYKYTYTMY